MSLRNRYKVVMHGNQPVVEDSESPVRQIKWFPDVLSIKGKNSRREAQQLADELNSKLD